MLILFCMLDFIPEYNNNHACFVTSDSILLRFMSFLLPSSLKYRELPILSIFLRISQTAILLSIFFGSCCGGCLVKTECLVYYQLALLWS